MAGAALVWTAWSVVEEVRVSANPVPYQEAQAEYAALVAALDAACDDGTCGFGSRRSSAKGDPEDTAEVRRQMARLRVRGATVDGWTATTTIYGAYGADYSLRYRGAATAFQIEKRAAADRAHQTWAFRRGDPVVVGAGWTRVPR